MNVMKKSFLILAAAAMFAACTNDSFRSDIEESQVEIDFSTYTQKSVGTKAGNGGSLYSFHNNFVVNAYKQIAGSPEPAFTNQLVTGSKSGETISWTYSPKKVWDKSADSYTFHAAAPSDGWTFNTGKYSRTVTLAGITMDAETGKFGADVDYMLAGDETIAKANYSSTPVNLTFKHILSRLNIAVKCTFDDAVYNVALNEVKVYNMINSGIFTEGAASGAGTITCWAPASSKFAAGVGYANATGLTLTSSAQMVYQSLIIPQSVAYVSGVALNGSGLTAESDPYLNIKYTVNEEQFDYSYNLADLFNGNTENDIPFNEGYQNTLTINIGLEEINFSADTDTWENGPSGNLDIN